MSDKPIITIDGPSGAGKSTISRLLAKRLGFIYLDTGALYRAVAFTLIRRGFSGEEQEISGFCRDMNLAVKERSGRLYVFVDGEDVTAKLRTEEIGLMASRVSAVPEVRKALLPVQRGIAKDGGVVAEGRDMGTIVFPEAQIKFYLDASLKERVGRRYRELIERGESTSPQEVETDMLLRDRQDQERAIAPLRPSPDAVIVDSTNHAILQIVDIMMGIIENTLHHRQA
mgnify:CR=1 FL=1